MEFPLTVSSAARDLKPHHIANYAYDLCSIFNEFYQAVPVLKAERGEKEARLVLVGAVKITLSNALSLLGIEAPEEM